MEHEFAKAWTFRDPMTTVEYPKGWKGAVPADRLKAAKADDVLVVPEPEPADEKPKRGKKNAE